MLRFPCNTIAPRAARCGLAFALAVMLTIATGCGDSLGGRLIGEWQGQPDNGLVRAKRKAQDQAARRMAEGLPPNPASELSPSTETTTATIVTDWEQLNFNVNLHFVDHKRVRMTIPDQRPVDGRPVDGRPVDGRPVEGVWRVISGSGNRVTIEVRTETYLRPDASDASQEADAPQEVRRFVVRFEGEKNDRFTLTEDGADPFVGMILFRKVKK